MKKTKQLIYTIVCIISTVLVYTQVAYAQLLTTEEAEQTIQAVGKEKVSGNILIWFLCAIAFLKIAQKMDSILATLGLNVGNTGSSMIGEAKAVMKTLSTMKGGARSNSIRNSSSQSQSSFLTGGLAGVIGRQITNTTMATVLGEQNNPLAEKMFDHSLGSNGKFAQDIVSNITNAENKTMGTLSGERANTAFKNYFGHTNNSSMDQMSTTHTSMEATQSTNNDSTNSISSMEGGSPVQTKDLLQATSENSAPLLFNSIVQEESALDSSNEMLQADNLSTDSIPLVDATQSVSSLNSDWIFNQESHSSVQSVFMDTQNTISSESEMISQEQNTVSAMSSEAGKNGSPPPPIMESSTNFTPTVETAFSESKSLSVESNLENLQTSYQNIEMSGGQITGTEVTSSNPEGISFSMYHANQYTTPTGDYSIVQSIDGSKWYKQYAVDTVKKTPYENSDGKIAYKEEIIKTVPQIPRQKHKGSS